ncbi:zinc transporter [Klebsiella pneumoniae]|nr:zinc transporter [Klebsiella pneumoniae]
MALTDHASEFIEQLHDRIIDLEDDLLESAGAGRADFSRCCVSS